ncbi:MAG: TetR/AcrR family transcriptional regulator [Sulfurovum sp.]|nr:TetR/AcrR family transcriptional regulator [Sulfurovaceae bacterium]
MNIKTKMKALKKDLILEKASNLFEEIGYENMKIADLAKDLGVSIGTIYSLFNNKEGLYLAYIAHQIDNFFSEYQEKVSTKSTPKQKIESFIELKFDYYNKKRKAIEQSATDNPLFFHSLYREHTNPFGRVYEYLAESFMELNPKLDTQQAMRMAFAVNGLSDGYIMQWLEIGDELLSRVDEATYLSVTMVKGCK